MKILIPLMLLNALVIDKDLYENQNLSIKFLCALYLCLSSGDLFILSIKVSPIFSYFCVIHTSVLCFSTWSLPVLRLF